MDTFSCKIFKSVKVENVFSACGKGASVFCEEVIATKGYGCKSGAKRILYMRNILSHSLASQVACDLKGVRLRILKISASQNRKHGSS